MGGQLMRVSSSRVEDGRFLRRWTHRLHFRLGPYSIMWGLWGIESPSYKMAPFYRMLLGFGVLGGALASHTPLRAGKEDEGLLECFEISQPVLGPEGPIPSW